MRYATSGKSPSPSSRNCTPHNLSHAVLIFKKIPFKHPLVIAGLFILLLVLSPFLRTSLMTVVRQPLRAVNWVRREINAVVFFHRNARLSVLRKDEIDVLRTRLSRMEEMRLENERLRELLDLRRTSDHRLLAARVIGRSADRWAFTLIIDKGERSGISRGMGVITRGGFVGRISNARSAVSKVLLISDPSLGISAMSQRSRQEGLISGTLGDMLIMRYLPDEPDIRAGDSIITSGLANIYPKGLSVGTVVEVNRDPSGLSYHALVKPAVDLSTIEEVLVILSPQRAS